MANTRIQFKRTTVTGRLPNTTNSANSSYIAAGEFAVNLTDGKVVSSNGTTTFEVGSNVTSIYVGGATINSTIYSATANNANNLNGQPASYYTNATNITTGTLPYAQLGANVVMVTNAATFTAVHTHNANVALVGNTTAVLQIGAAAANIVANSTLITISSNTTVYTTINATSINTLSIVANGGIGTNGQVLTSNGAGMYWGTAGGGSGATLTANNTDTQTFYLPMANTTSGSWTNAVVSSTKLTFVPSTGVLTTPSINIQNAIEPVTVVASAATGTINYDAITQSILYYSTNASANWTINVRGNSTNTLNTVMANNQALTIVFLASQGATAYFANAVTIDSVAVTPKWQQGYTPTAGNANGIDAYTLTIIKTANATYTVVGSQTQFA